VLVHPPGGSAITDLDGLHPGDILFFHDRLSRPRKIVSVGIYVGVDDAGRHRFVASRARAGGPTVGDEFRSVPADADPRLGRRFLEVTCTLDATGFFGRHLAAVRRF
jgi:hypothetical protein